MAAPRIGANFIRFHAAHARRPGPTRTSARSRAGLCRCRARLRRARAAPVFHISELSHVIQPAWRPPWSYRSNNLRMTDVEAVGGKNASPRRNDQPAGRLGRARARRLRHHGACLPRSSCAHGGLAAAHRRRAWPRSTPTTCARWPRPAPRSARWIEAQPFPADLEDGDPRGVRDADRRQPRARRSRCARRPPPKTCPTRRSPASRRPSSTSSASTTCCTR